MRQLLQRLALGTAFTGALASPKLAHAEAVTTESHTVVATPVREEKEAPPALVSFQLGEAIWIIVIFVILVYLLKQTAWKNILAGLKAREDRIRKDISDAEAARHKAEATLKDYNTQLATADGKVRELLSSAAAEGERIGATIRARAQQEGEEIKEKALRDIETARKQAVAEIYDQAALLATSIAEKIIRRSLNPDDQRDLVARSLEQLHGVGKN